MGLVNLFQILKGGSGSGNRGHSGRPGLRGGSKGSGSYFGSNTKFYHGSSSEIKEFDNKHIGTGADASSVNWYGNGIYLTQEPWKAASYGFSAGKGNVVTTTVKVKNPLIVKGTGAGKLDKSLEEIGLDSTLRGSELSKVLQNKGYDSIAVMKDNGKKVNELVVFNSKDIEVKSNEDVKDFWDKNK